MPNDLQHRLIEGLRSGDRKIFEEIFRMYYSPLCRYCLRYVSDTQIAEEIVQDLFFRLWEKREKLILHLSLQSYLYKSVKNYSINYINQLKIQEKHRQYVGFNAKESQEPIDQLEEIDLELLINNTILKLPEKRREVFELSRHEGLKYSEIAEKLNISIKTVEAQMSKSLEQLRLVLKEYLPLILMVLINNMR
ncbi:MAG: RNA polymerase sigma-70 factor [Bacteroidales bacterium]|nr:RNA polymerase sigma-70 factor [Bacteroidales bacterium]